MLPDSPPPFFPSSATEGGWAIPDGHDTMCCSTDAAPDTIKGNCMKTLFAVILMIGALNILSGCTMMHDSLYGEGDQGRVGTESNRGIQPRNHHGH